LSVFYSGLVPPLPSKFIASGNLFFIFLFLRQAFFLFKRVYSDSSLPLPYDRPQHPSLRLYELISSFAEDFCIEGTLPSRDLSPTSFSGGHFDYVSPFLFVGIASRFFLLSLCGLFLPGDPAPSFFRYSPCRAFSGSFEFLWFWALWVLPVLSHFALSEAPCACVPLPFDPPSQSGLFSTKGSYPTDRRRLS